MGPCAFIHNAIGCQNGINCEFCHLCEPGEKKRRQKERWEKKNTYRRKMDGQLPLGNEEMHARPSPPIRPTILTQKQKPSAWDTIGQQAGQQSEQFPRLEAGANVAAPISQEQTPEQWLNSGVPTGSDVEAPYDQQQIDENGLATSDPYSYAGQKGKGNGLSCFERIPVGLEDDNEFHVMQRLIGPRGKHIQDITRQAKGSKVWIIGRGSR